LDNGIAELACLDSDANGWLDEADPQWGPQGLEHGYGGQRDYLTSLRDRGVGAIRETSIFVDEQRGVGTVQEVDLGGLSCDLHNSLMACLTPISLHQMANVVSLNSLKYVDRKIFSHAKPPPKEKPLTVFRGKRTIPLLFATIPILRCNPNPHADGSKITSLHIK
jgi:hypothetical protein